MAVYTFHVPGNAARGDAKALEQAVLVRDGFSWSALIFQVLWCLWNGLWLVALAFLLVSVALSFGLEWAGVPDAAIGLAGLLLAILFALEANNLRRLSLERRGLALRGVVVAPDLHEAERRAFSVWLEGDGQGQGQRQGQGTAPAGPLQHAPARAKPAYAARDPEVIGLFPAAEEPR
ncbi:DUF2628 domain-containing protein [Pseudochelatococcus sp. B33]